MIEYNDLIELNEKFSNAMKYELRFNLILNSLVSKFEDLCQNDQNYWMDLNPQLTVEYYIKEIKNIMKIMKFDEPSNEDVLMRWFLLVQRKNLFKGNVK